jgi:hypothetical protein
VHKVSQSQYTTHFPNLTLSGNPGSNLILVTEIKIQFVFPDESRKLLRIQLRGNIFLRQLSVASFAIDHPSRGQTFSSYFSFFPDESRKLPWIQLRGNIFLRRLSVASFVIDHPSWGQTFLFIFLFFYTSQGTGHASLGCPKGKGIRSRHRVRTLTSAHPP